MTFTFCQYTNDNWSFMLWINNAISVPIVCYYKGITDLSSDTTYNLSFYIKDRTKRDDVKKFWHI